MKKLAITLIFIALAASSIILLSPAPSEAHCRSYRHSHYNPYGPDYYGYGCGYGYGGWPYGDYDPYYSPYPYSYPWPVVPPVVIQPTPPAVVQPPSTYIEKHPSQPQPTEQPPAYLSYCAENDKFYPEIGQCSGGWLKVISSPAPADAWKYWRYCRDPKKKGFSPYIPDCLIGWLYVIPETTPPK